VARRSTRTLRDQRRETKTGNEHWDRTLPGKGGPRRPEPTPAVTADPVRHASRHRRPDTPRSGMARGDAGRRR